MVAVVKGGGFRRTLDLFLFKGCEGCRGVELRRVRRERLCARVLERRSVARNAAVTSGDGGSPKMKNLIKAPMRMTMESWPRRSPWVKERLGQQSESYPMSLALELDLRGLGLGKSCICARHFAII